jgi:hypothetical protein
MAEQFSARLKREAGPAAEMQIQRAFQLAFGRPASASEVTEAKDLVARHGLAALCRVLFNANEFVYVM